MDSTVHFVHFITLEISQMLFKRTILTGGGVILVSALLFGHEAISYVRTTAGYVENTVKDSIPVKFQIDRARQMVKDLEPAVKEHLHLIAKEEVQLERLSKQIEESKKQSETAEAKILRLRNDLDSEQSVFQYAGRSYSRTQVKVDLANRFKQFKTSEATLENLEKIRDVRQKSLDAAREKFEGLLAMRRQLMLEIESLEAQHQMVAAAKTSNRYEFDDSQLGSVKKLVDDLQVRLDTESKLADVSDSLRSEIPLDEPNQTDIVDQVTEYFGLGTPDSKTVAATE